MSVKRSELCMICMVSAVIYCFVKFDTFVICHVLNYKVWFVLPQLVLLQKCMFYLFLVICSGGKMSVITLVTCVLYCDARPGY